MASALNRAQSLPSNVTGFFARVSTVLKKEPLSLYNPSTLSSYLFVVFDLVVQYDPIRVFRFLPG